MHWTPTLDSRQALRSQRLDGGFVSTGKRVLFLLVGSVAVPPISKIHPDVTMDPHMEAWTRILWRGLGSHMPVFEGPRAVNRAPGKYI